MMWTSDIEVGQLLQGPERLRQVLHAKITEKVSS